MNAKFVLTPRLATMYSSIFASFGIFCIILSYIPIITRSYTVPGAIMIVAGFVAVLPALAFASLKVKWLVHVYVAMLNAVAFFAFLYYIGTYTPFVLLWIMILIISYLYSGVISFIASSILLIVETALVLFVYSNVGVLSDDSLPVYFVLSLVVAVATIGVGYLFIVMITRARERAKHLAASQQAEQMQLNRLNTLLNSISDTVLTLNRYGRITSQNSAALSFFDTNQSLVGKNIDSVADLRDESLKPMSLRKLAENIRTTIIRDDVSIKDSNGSVMRLSIQLSPIHGKFGDDDNGCVVIIRDITRQKTLEDEKDEFISVTSHELRTPIAIAEGSLSNLLYMFEKGAPAEKLSSSATAAHDQVLYLAKMINDLSTLSRAERGVGDAPEEINLNTLFQDLYLHYQPEAESKGLKLDLDIEHLPTISTSKLYLEEILQNFITNAIKYTKEGTVTLSGKLKGGHVQCAVSDTGIGISKTDQAKVFEKFFRSEDYRTRETSGTGLGLYVVKKLADKLNITIEIDSRLNHGTTFSFVLPEHVATPDKKSIKTS